MLGKGKYKLSVSHVHIFHENMLYKQWVDCTPEFYQIIYSRVDNCVYSSILGSFDDCKVVKF